MPGSLWICGRKFNRMSTRSVTKPYRWWRDACLLYFQQYSRRSIPADCPPPVHDLEELMEFRLHLDNYTAADMDKLP